MSVAGIIPTKILYLQFGGGLALDRAEQVLSKTLSSVEISEFVKSFVFQFLSTWLRSNWILGVLSRLGERDEVLNHMACTKANNQIHLYIDSHTYVSKWTRGVCEIKMLEVHSVWVPAKNHLFIRRFRWCSSGTWTISLTSWNMHS